MEQVNGLPFKFYFENVDKFGRILPNNLSKIELDEYNTLCSIDYNWDSFLRERRTNKFSGTLSTGYVFKHNLQTTDISDDVLYYICESYTPVPYYNNEFINNISDNVLDRLKSNQLKVIFNWFGEPLYDVVFNNQIETFCRDNNINPSNFFILTSANNIPTNSNINYISDHFFLANTAQSLKLLLRNKTYKSNQVEFTTEIVDHSVFDTKKQKHFISMNRHVDRPHRYALGLFLEKNNLWDIGNFSFLVCHNPKNVDELNEVLSKVDAQSYMEYDSIFFNKIPMELDTQFLDKRINISEFRTSEIYYKPLYMESAINIVTETTFTNNRVFLSEKTFHPIINLQPFIVFSSNGHLKIMQELGFKTFSPYINEEYDNETNSQKRFKMVCDEILRISQFDITELNQLLLELKNICIYNRNHLLSFTKYDVFENSLQKIKNYGI
jgi:hypothetical protein